MLYLDSARRMASSMGAVIGVSPSSMVSLEVSTSLPVSITPYLTRWVRKSSLVIVGILNFLLADSRLKMKEASLSVASVVR